MPVTYNPGTVIASRYEIQEILGRGGVGITYAAQMLSNGEPVALKIVSLAGLEDWKSVELLKREAQVLAQLDHPRIPSYLDYFTIERDREYQFCIVQKLAPGKSVAQLVEEGWRTSEKEIKHIAVQVLETLTYLHQLDSPVIHRDIKPENLIRAEDGSIYLVDFGAVREKYQTELTQGSTVVGTFGYMAPEQFKGRAVAATDLYGLGATLLYLLTHRSPMELPHDTLKINFRSRVKVSEAFADWLEKLLEPDLNQRFYSAKQALGALKKTQLLKAKGWLKLGTSVVGALTIAVLGFQSRWFVLSHLGYYPTSCINYDLLGDTEERMNMYLEQGGNLTQLVAHPNSSFWCGLDQAEKRSVARSPSITFLNASDEGHLEVVERLLAAGIDPNVQDDRGRSPLSYASGEDNTPDANPELVKPLLEAGANPNLQDEKGDTPLHWASRETVDGKPFEKCKSECQVIEKLLAAGANPNIENDAGRTPLYYQVNPRIAGYSLRHQEVVERLLDAGARVKLKTLKLALREQPSLVKQLLAAEPKPEIQLSIVAYQGHVEQVNQLLEAGTNVHFRGYDQKTPLDYASSQGHPEVVKLLLNAGARIRLKTLKLALDNEHPSIVQRLLTAEPKPEIQLSFAAYRGNLKKVNLLLEAGANVNFRALDGSTPLHQASFSNSRESLQVVEALLKAGANSNLRNEEGDYPLHELIYFCGSCEYVNLRLKILETLLKAGANPNLRDGNHKTSLHLAYGVLGDNYLRFAERLLEAGANPNVRDEDGNTPLHLASDYDDRTGEALLKAGANPNIQNHKGNTPLHIACKEDVITWNLNYKISETDNNIEALLKAGANPNVQNHKGNTPLHNLLNHSKEYEAVKRLLEAGANPNLKDSEGKTSLEVSPDGEIRKLLKRHGAKR